MCFLCSTQRLQVRLACLVLLAWGAGHWGSVMAAQPPATWGICYEERPEANSIAAFDWCVVTSAAAEGFTAEQKKRGRLIARLSRTAEREGRASWRLQAKSLIAAGCAGVVAEFDEAQGIEAARLSIAAIRAEIGDALIVTRAPSGWAPELAGRCDAWMVEGEEVGRMCAEVAEVRAANPELAVLANAWLLPQQAADARALADRLAAAGAIPCVTTPERDGHFFAPLASVPRRVLCFHGDGEDHSRPWFPADTASAAYLQTPLEWMGYETDYQLIDDAAELPKVLPGRYAAVLVDGSMRLPVRREGEWVDWVLTQVGRGVKVLFLGQYPLEQDGERQRLIRGLGIEGTGMPADASLGIASIVNPRGAMNADVPVHTQKSAVPDVRAPSAAMRDIQLEGRDATANPVCYDPVFTASWGGVLLDPYFTFQATASDVRFVCDPYAWLARILPSGAFPVPDPTTWEGRRVFYFQIDGDGFAFPCQFDARRTCGEVMIDEVLKKTDLPVTCSVIEAEIRGEKIDQGAGDAEAVRKLAREMFALPNVEAASHSYSHPFVWIDDDVEYLPQYPRRNLELNPSATAAYPAIVAEREVAGSIRYIQDELLPVGKKVEMMLWSGNCRPSAAALACCGRLGVENMNGGGATVCDRRPSLANVPPRTMTWGGELQINSSMQNEFVFTRDWNGPFFGGFKQVLQTFERTESPRRLAPIDVYCHFYSAQHFTALKALKDILAWCQARPIQPMPASRYAKIARDSRSTVVFQSGEGEWLVCNSGHLRTLRFPAEAGQPLVAPATGLLGASRSGDAWYLHTADTGVVRIGIRPGAESVSQLNPGGTAGAKPVIADNK